MPSTRRIAGITIELGADTKDFIKGVRDIDKEINKTQSTLKDINKLLKFDPENSGLLAQKQKNLRDAIDQTKERLKQLKSVSADSLSPEDYDTLQREIADTEISLKSMEDEYKKLGDTGTSKMAAVGEAIKKVGQGVFEAGKAITEHLLIPMAKVGAAALAAGAGAVAGLTKAATEAYADYEQLVGGVETLFGAGGQSLEEYAASVGKSVDDARADYDKLMGAQDTVLANSQDAWKTTGLSANEYMETVTGFSASLISSLKGDTEKAAAQADKAMVQMADNANKMGTDISNLQTAYSGFAKGQFQLLDNLKLGYGGTKTEMERLLKDAQKLQKQQGKNVKYSIDNFSDIVDAIQVVQDEMGITGTTAQEAEKTINGSLNATKAAWQNVLVAFAGGGDDIKSAIDDLVNSGINVIKNIIPVIKNVMQNIGGAVKQIAPIIAENLGPLLEDILPALIDAAASLVGAIANALPEILPVLGKAFLQIVDILKGIDWLGIGKQIWAWLASAFSAIGTWASEKFGELVTAIKAIDWAAVGTAIWDWIKGAFATVSEWATTKFDEMKTAITSIKWADVGTAIWDWIKNAFPDVAAWFESVFSQAADAMTALGWSEKATEIWNAIKGVFEGVVNFFKTTFESVKAALTGEISWSEAGDAIWGAIKGAFAGVGDFFKSIFGDAATAIFADVPWSETADKIWEAIKAVFGAVIDFFKTTFESVKAAITGEISWGEAGQAIWNAIKAVFESIGEWYKTLFESVKTIITSIDWATVGSTMWNAIKGAFGSIGAWFTEKFGEVKTAIWSINWATVGKQVWDWIKNAIVYATEAPVKFFKNTFNAVVDAVKKIDWKGLGTAIWDWIKSAFDGIGKWFVDTFKAPINAVIKMLNGLINKVEDGVNSVINGINKALTINIPAIDGPFGIHWDGFRWSPNLTNVNWPDIKELAMGGILGEGGHAIVGEHAPEYLRVINGRAVVTPLDKNGNAWRMGDSEQNVTINIYQQPGQSAQELAHAVQRVLVQQQKQRAVAYA